MTKKHAFSMMMIFALFASPLLGYGQNSFSQKQLAGRRFPTTPSIVPNEVNPALSLPLLARAPRGALVAVGTERAFAAMAAAPQLTHLLMVDSDPNVILFNRFNLALLKIAKGDRNLYLHLRLQARPSEILAMGEGAGLDGVLMEALRLSTIRFSDRSFFENYKPVFGNEKSVQRTITKLVGTEKAKEIMASVSDNFRRDNYEIKKIEKMAQENTELSVDELQELKNFIGWASSNTDYDLATRHSLLNEIRDSRVSNQKNPFFYPQGPNFNYMAQRVQWSLNPVFKGMNYLHDENLFQRLSTLAVEDKIFVLHKDLGSSKEMIDLAEEMSRQNIPLSILDVSNAWEGTFMQGTRLAKLVDSFQAVAQKNSLLVITDSPNYSFKKWSYYGFTFATIPNGVESAHAALSSRIGALPGAPVLGKEGARPHVKESQTAGAYLDGVFLAASGGSARSCDEALQ